MSIVLLLSNGIICKEIRGSLIRDIWQVWWEKRTKRDEPGSKRFYLYMLGNDYILTNTELDEHSLYGYFITQENVEGIFAMDFDGQKLDVLAGL